MRLGPALVAALLSLALGSCSLFNVPELESTASRETPPVSTVSPPAEGEKPPMSPTTPAHPAPSLLALVEEARDDLAGRLSVPAEQVTLTDARAVLWSDSSLGCPQAGLYYTDMLTPGFLILLNVDGREYEYHAGKDAKVFFCENPIRPIEGEPGNT